VSACTAPSVQIPDVAGSPDAAAEDQGPGSRFDPPPGSVSLSPDNCPAAAIHVYHPGRLWLLHGCQTTTLRGTIEYKKGEPDGDYHVRLKLDIGQSCYGQACINTQNVKEQYSDLVLEPVWVFDDQHGWDELHPLTAIRQM
jgi:hypothetical protein